MYVVDCLRKQGDTAERENIAWQLDPGRTVLARAFSTEYSPKQNASYGHPLIR